MPTRGCRCPRSPRTDAEREWALATQAAVCNGEPRPPPQSGALRGGAGASTTTAAERAEAYAAQDSYIGREVICPFQLSNNYMQPFAGVVAGVHARSTAADPARS